MEDKTGLCMCLRYATVGHTRLLAGAYENGECYFWDSAAYPVFSTGKLHSEPGFSSLPSLLLPWFLSLQDPTNLAQVISLDIAERRSKVCGITGSAGTNVSLFRIDNEQVSDGVCCRCVACS